ncbi:hypothetical protein ACWA2C_16195 [Priestia megaterium]|nr:hypothetical protein [Priestia megaterium]
MRLKRYKRRHPLIKKIHQLTDMKDYILWRVSSTLDKSHLKYITKKRGV